MAATLILLMSMGCRYTEMTKRAAVAAVVTSIHRMQSHAPLTQNSVARPAAKGRGRRLVTQVCSSQFTVHGSQIKVATKRTPVTREL